MLDLLAVKAMLQMAMARFWFPQTVVVEVTALRVEPATVTAEISTKPVTMRSDICLMMKLSAFLAVAVVEVQTGNLLVLLGLGNSYQAGRLTAVAVATLTKISAGKSTTMEVAQVPALAVAVAVVGAMLAVGMVPLVQSL
jgi:hypothetical protein